MKKEIQKLLGDLCNDLGFCIPPDEAGKIKQKTYLEADQFACLVLEAEKMDIEKELKWRREIRNEFNKRFGNVLSSD